MASALWGKFASEVLKEVRFKYDHNAIRQELMEHMEELWDDLMAEGVDAEVAEQMAVTYMGDAKEIGQALDQEHSPWLGWLWRLSRWAVVITAVVCLFWWLAPTALFLGTNLLERYEERPKEMLVWQMDVDKTVEIYGERIHVDELLYYKDGELEIRANTLNLKRKWNDNTSALTRGNRITVADETGAQYEVVFVRTEGDGTLWQGPYFLCQIYVGRFPADAEKLYIGYDWQRKDFIEIDLPKGGTA